MGLVVSGHGLTRPEDSIFVRMAVLNRHGPKPGCQEAEAEAFSILEAEAEALTLFKLEAEALVMKPKPKPGYL